MRIVPAGALQLTIAEVAPDGTAGTQASPVTLACELNPPATAQLTLTSFPNRDPSMVGLSDEFQTEIENQTQYAVTIESLELTNTAANDANESDPFSVSDWQGCTEILMPRDACRASLFLTPSSPGNHAYTMTVHSNLASTRVDINRDSIAVAPKS